MFNLTNIQNHKSKIVLKFFETVNTSHVYSYADLYRDSALILKTIEELRRNMADAKKTHDSFNVAILLSVHSPAILPTIVGLENAGCASCFLNPKDIVENIKKRLIDYETNVVLCDLKNLDKLNIGEDDVRIFSKLTIFKTKCLAIQFDGREHRTRAHSINDNVDKSKSSDVLFYATTSGSYGEVKPIGVTYKCFMPNIISLGELFCVTKDDVIYVSSPPTFDPFMVDVCMAIHYGASLIMTTNSLKCDAGQLLNVLFPCDKQSEVTIIQTTPSLFMRWSKNQLSDRVFSLNSQLRILAFGGEPFPATNQLFKWINWHRTHRLRIFNLYGLTEMSCWACVYEISKDDITFKRKIPIGKAIDANTIVEIAADGELLLKSKIRKCFQSQITDAHVIDNEFEFTLHTGDLVEIENESRIYFISRSNSIVKFFGQKINLCEIENRAKAVDGVDDAVCTHDEKQNAIILFVKIQGNADDIKLRITQTLRTIGIHVKVYCIANFPLTAHGKICKNDLLNTIDNKEMKFRSESVHMLLQQLINECLGTKMELVTVDSKVSQKKSKTDINSSFIHLGGTSLKAIQIVDEFERNISHTIPHILPMLLNERISIHEILSHLMDANWSRAHFHSANEMIPQIDVRWKINMEKCIDATPTVCVLNDATIISVGSHSKLLYNISVENGKIISKLELPDRIESQVIQFQDCGIVGCYDGYLYCFDIRSGEIKWNFNSGAMIKCRALIIGEFVIFGNYNEVNNLWCLKIENGTMIWSCRIGTKSIYANPIKLYENNCIVCSLDGTVAVVNKLTSKIKWTFQAESPIFSTPSVLTNNQQNFQIILATVNGTIHLLNSDGVSIWSHKIDGNIFSSIEYFMNTDENTHFLIGSQNHYLYCFKIESNGTCKEDWSHKTNASIRSTPILMNNDLNSYVGIFSSDGVFQILISETGKLTHQSKVDGKVFSTPAKHDKSLFVGSRDNFLYCIDIPDFIRN